jgi:OFA family oxalate/formate antiporter-like MFS transporter
LHAPKTAAARTAKKKRISRMSPQTQKSKPVLESGWVQLAVGVACVACVANLQYGWTLFVNPIDARYHFGAARIQVAFTVFVLFETWLVPLEGYLVDRFDPRHVLLAGAVLVVTSWLIDSIASSLPLLYLGGALGGLGVGCVYGTCIGNALKWFPSKRGLAAGITAAGYGTGAALTIGPIDFIIRTSGYEHAFTVFALLQGGIVAILSAAVVAAPPALQAVHNAEQTRRDYTPAEVLRSPVFYVMYLLYVLVSVGGLTLAASMAPIALDLQVDGAPLQVFGLSVPVLVLALSVSRISDGLARPFFGWISDRIGRELTMAVAFILGAAALFMLDSYGTHRLGFIVLTAVYFGAYGEIFSLFPATAADTFGARFATANAGMLYTAKGLGALLVPVATSYASHSHGWSAVFTAAMCFNLIAAVLAIFALAPMRERHLSEAIRSSGAVFKAAPSRASRRAKERESLQ